MNKLLEFYDALKHDAFIEGRGTPFTDEEKQMDAKIIAALEGPSVTKEWIKRVAKIMTNAADPHEKLTTEELLAVTEGNENYLEKEIRALILGHAAKEGEKEKKDGNY